MKFLEKEANGITLIALVVTIVVLIILATVSINLVLGDNGIISQAQEAKEVTRGASAKEEIDIWKINIEADKLTNSTIAESKEDLLDRLVENGTYDTEVEQETRRWDEYNNKLKKEQKQLQEEMTQIAEQISEIRKKYAQNLNE